MSKGHNNDCSKKALVIRCGAFGDMVMITPVLRVLKEEGYHVTVYMTDRSKAVLKDSPLVDDFIILEDGAFSRAQLEEKWAETGKDFDKVVNLTGSIENNLLKAEGTEEFSWSQEKRHKMCNRNYYDESLRIAGYEDIKGRNGELFFTASEECRAKQFRKKYKNKFIVVWALSGSSFHKVWPYAEYVAKIFLQRHPNAMILTVGDALCQVLEWSHPRTKSYSGKWPLRKAMAMVKHADLFVGPETGMTVAAGCFDTPKVVMLSHATDENLTKYWENVYPVSARVACYPCHQLHYSLESCPIDQRVMAPVCMASLKGEQVLNPMEEVYDKWSEKRKGAGKKWQRQQHQHSLR